MSGFREMASYQCVDDAWVRRRRVAVAMVKRDAVPVQRLETSGAYNGSDHRTGGCQIALNSWCSCGMDIPYRDTCWTFVDLMALQAEEIEEMSMQLKSRDVSPQSNVGDILFARLWATCVDSVDSTDSMDRAAHLYLNALHLSHCRWQSPKPSKNARFVASNVCLISRLFRSKIAYEPSIELVGVFSCELLWSPEWHCE